MVATKPKFSVDASAVHATSFPNEQNGYIRQYTINKTYELLGPPLSRSKLFKNFAGNDAETSVTYRMDFGPLDGSNEKKVLESSRNRRAEASATKTGPGNFYVNAQTGSTLANPKNGGKYEGSLVAVDKSGVKVLVKQWEFEVVGACFNKSKANFCKDRGIPQISKDYACICTACHASTGPNCEVQTDTDSSAGGNSTDNTQSIIIGSTFGSMLMLFIAVVGYQRRKTYQLSIKAFDFKEELDRLLAAGEIEKEVVTEDNLPREVSRKSLTMTEKLGSGAFGDVWQAVLDESRITGVPAHSVAVKTVKTNQGEAAQELFREATVMAQIAGPYTGHPNLVSLVGAVTSGTPLLLLVSLCEKGSLLDVLKSDVELPANERMDWNMKVHIMVGTAKGMKHLADHRFVHRDLAARNVLIDGAWCAKVADFGLSRSVQQDPVSGSEGYYYRSQRGIFPVRWSAPESMQDLLFTSHSDVWSFGVVIHEILDDGKKPYAEFATNQIVISKVSNGYRMLQRGGCDDHLYRMLLQCWDANHEKRPSFDEILIFFSKTYSITDVLPRASKTSTLTTDHYEYSSGDAMSPRDLAAVQESLPGLSALDSAGYTIAPPRDDNDFQRTGPGKTTYDSNGKPNYDYVLPATNGEGVQHNYVQPFSNLPSEDSNDHPSGGAFNAHQNVRLKTVQESTERSRSASRSSIVNSVYAADDTFRASVSRCRFLPS